MQLFFLVSHDTNNAERWEIGDPIGLGSENVSDVFLSLLFEIFSSPLHL
jgi:hypothetical protein